ncbi:MAG: hypothetical protein M3N57_06005, partial [Actinomycetota bacterium]|nr:hypothetical protein [Actinomycetota bacterium]
EDSRLDAGQLDTLFQVVERIDGFPRHLALHPCGIVLADVDLMDVTPVERSAGTGRDGPAPHGFSMTQFDKDDVAALGLLKLDILAVRLLSSMRHAIELVPATRGEEIDLDAIPFHDPAVYELLRTTRSIGVFQVESPGQRELLGRLQPDRFDDLVTEISLFRPGPVKADMVGPFVARRTGDEPATYIHPLLEPALEDTFGVVIYHEQVMKAVAALTGCNLSRADLVRRQLADDTQLPHLRGWALTTALERGIDRATAEAVWRQVESFASFGFCKAHAAAFAVPTYRSAWLKVHYLPELIAGLLTHDPGMYPRRLLLEEARQFGVAVLPADVNVSAAEYTVERVAEEEAYARLEVGRGAPLPVGWTWSGTAAADRGMARCGGWFPDAGTTADTDRACPVGRDAGDAGGACPVPPAGRDAGDAGVDHDGRRWRWAVRVGLQDVRGMTDAERDTLIAGRPYTCLEDVRARGGLSRPTAENLAKIGALDEIGCGDRRVTLLAVEELWGPRRGRRGSRPGGGATPDPQATLALYADHRPRLPQITSADQVRDELEVLGLDVSRHVVAFYEPVLDVLGVTRAADLERDDSVAAPHPTGGGALVPPGRVRVAGVRAALQSPPVRSGQRVLFLSLDDRTGTTQCNFFERALAGDGRGDRGHAWTVLHAWLVVVEGRLDRRGPRGITVIAERAWDLTRLWRAWGEGRLDEELARSGPPPPHRRTAARPSGLSAAMFASGSR